MVLMSRLRHPLHRLPPLDLFFLDIHGYTPYTYDVKRFGKGSVAERAAKVFNGIYTVKSAQTGDHRTFKIHAQDEKAEFAPGKRIVSLLTGSENSADESYTGFAFIDDDGIHVWSKKRGQGLWETYADMLWSFSLDAAGSPWAAKGFTIMGEGRCVRCNRLLTEPTSLKTGIGPICAGR